MYKQLIQSLLIIDQDNSIYLYFKLQIKKLMLNLT